MKPIEKKPAAPVFNNNINSKKPKVNSGYEEMIDDDDDDIILVVIKKE